MISLSGDPLKLILKEAFRVSLDQIVGPSWLEAEYVQIAARLPAGAGTQQVPEMLQSLLIERLKLSFHKEKLLRPGYELVVDKSGLKVKESDLNSAYNITHSGQVTFRANAGAAGLKGSMTMPALARRLSSSLHAPVEDLTGLKQKYDVDVSWSADRQPGSGNFAQSPAVGAPVDPADDIFSAICNSLGLRLQPRKEQVEFVVIDHIDRVPVAN